MAREHVTVIWARREGRGGSDPDTANLRQDRRERYICICVDIDGRKE